MERSLGVFRGTKTPFNLSAARRATFTTSELAGMAWRHFFIHSSLGGGSLVGLELTFEKILAALTMTHIIGSLVT